MSALRGVVFIGCLVTVSMLRVVFIGCVVTVSMLREVVFIGCVVTVERIKLCLQVALSLCQC